MNATDIAMIVFCVLIAGVFVVGIINKIRHNGIKSVLDDESVIVVKKILVNCIGEVLSKVGIEGDYETYKEKVFREVLKHVREYIDEKGGLIDTITDEISDDQILELIDEALQLSGMEDTVKKAFDALVKKRVEDIESDEDLAASLVGEDGFAEDDDENYEELPNPLVEPDNVETDETE